MSKHDGCVRAFHWSSKAWYAKAAVKGDEIMFGMYVGGGGTSGEMAMRWIDIGKDRTPRLEAFDDSWSALALFPDLIQALAKYDGKNITPEEFVQILKDHAFQDFTEYKR